MRIPEILDPDVAGKLSKNLSAALSAAASPTSPSPSSSLASSVFESSSPLFGTLASSQQHLAKSLARTLEIGMGVQLEDVSLQWFGYEDSAKGTDAAIVGGYDSLVKKLAEDVRTMGGEIQLDARVDGVKLGEEEGSPVNVTISNGNSQQTRHSSRLVLSTIPLALLQKSHAQLLSGISARKAHAIDHAHVGKLGKVVVSYDDAWWPTDVGAFTILPTESSGNGETPTDNIEQLLKTVPLVVSSFAIATAPADIQPAPATHPTLLIYLPVPAVQHLEGRSASDVGQAMHNYLASSIPTAKPCPSSPKHSVLTNWAYDPYSLGATSTPLTVQSVAKGITPASFIELGRPETLGAADGKPRVLFAGEHTSVNNRGSVTGAVESGLREGRRAVQLLDL